MSLAFTAPTKANMFEFIQERLWYSFEERTAEWDAWTAANPSDPYATSHGGRAVTVMMSTSFIAAWSVVPAAFVKKWSGACLRDYSSGAGGWCILETNDTDMTGTSDTVQLIYDVVSNGDTSTVEGESTNRGIEFYRLSDAEFLNGTGTGDLENAWTDLPVVDTTTGFKDGRCYYTYITGASYANKSNQMSTGTEYLDYPYCANDGASDEWFCQLYLPLRDQ